MSLKTIKLKYFCEVKDGTHDTPQYVEKSDESIPFVTSKDIINGKIDFSEVKYISKNDHDKFYQRSNVENGDVLMPMIGTIGNPALVSTGKIFSIKNVALFKTSNNLIKARYLYYLLSSSFMKEQLELMKSGGVQSFVSLSVLRNLEIIVHDNLELIVQFLDNKMSDIDSLITDKERLIELLEEKRQAVITETVTKGLDPNVKMKDSGIEWIGKIPEHWDALKLKFIGKPTMGLLYSPNDLSTSTEGMLVLRASNIQSGQIELDRNDNVYVNKDIPEELITKPGDILICARSGSKELIGKSGLIDDRSAGKSFGAFTTVYRSSYNDFISYVFQSGLFTSQIGTYLTSTINQLTMTNLKNLEIVFPPIPEQEEIVCYLNKYIKNVNDVTLEIRQQIQKLKEYRESLIYEAVTGKIDLRHYEVDPTEV